ncbi:MAG: helix-turn-helix transcriptional regulator [Micropruina sp.]
MARPNPKRSIGFEANLARRIATEREARRMSYGKLARLMTAAGCPIQSSSLYKIENSEPRRRITVDELQALSMVFLIPVEDLLRPIELVKQERANELARRMSSAHDEIITNALIIRDIYAEMLGLWAEFKDEDILEFILNTYFATRRAAVKSRIATSRTEGEPAPVAEAREELEAAVVEVQTAALKLAGEEITHKKKGP